VYHVYNRVASGERVFTDPEEAVRFVDLIRTVKERDGWTVFAWNLMSNHFHVALRTSAVPLARGMHHLQCMFSRGFNRRSRRTGSLWQSRYQAKLVDEQRYLSQLVLYVHLNPVRAGAVEDPVEHVFSGHREIVKRVRDPLVDVDDALLSFGETARAGLRAYLSAIREGSEGGGGPVQAAVDAFRSLRSGDRELEPRPGNEHVDSLGLSTGLERPAMSVERFVDGVCELLRVSPERLASRKRDKSTAEARRIVATLGAKRWAKSRTELARLLGKSPDVVSYWVGQGVGRRLEDPEFARKLDEIDRAMAESTASAASEDAHQAPNPEHG